MEKESDVIQQQANEERQAKNDYRGVFLGSDAGKRVLLDILQAGSVLRPVYVKGDIERSAYNEGMRAIALEILDKLDVRGYQDIIDLESEGVNLLKLGEYSWMSD